MRPLSIYCWQATLSVRPSACANTPLLRETDKLKKLFTLQGQTFTTDRDLAKNPLTVDFGNDVARADGHAYRNYAWLPFQNSYSRPRYLFLSIERP